jgi:thioester reductase-like protein
MVASGAAGYQDFALRFLEGLVSYSLTPDGIITPRMAASQRVAAIAESLV